jgi:hypothetical protein
VSSSANSSDGSKFKAVNNRDILAIDTPDRKADSQAPRRLQRDAAAVSVGSEAWGEWWRAAFARAAAGKR